MRKFIPSNQRGSIVVSIMVIMIFLTITILSLGVISQTNVSRSIQRIYQLQAQYAAESGADAVVAYINDPATGTFPNDGVEKEIYSQSPYFKATYTASIADDPMDNNRKSVTSTGKVYVPANATTPRYTYKILDTVERSSLSSVSTITSRNSVEVDSSVKQIKATSLYVNEYLRANKNTNEIMVDDLTVVGKYPDASLCSLSGAGDLIHNPALGATKTKIRLGYNNCLSVEAPASNFDITENDNTLTKIASIYIPWSYKMDDSYLNGNCSDWTVASPVIPSTGNAKKTHYPDKNSGVTTRSACGGAGSAPADINLGSKTITIKDDVHLRANLCLASACKPTFVNPDAGTTKFIFVEGVINFDNVYVNDGVAYPNGGTPPTVSPGNVVFISYSVSANIGTPRCPGGASIRLGKDGSKSIYAPNGYFVATNGMLCVDQTKFETGVESLGGVSGKDIFLSSNSGATFEMSFNPEFPLSSIPLDLAWRSTNVKRVY